MTNSDSFTNQSGTGENQMTPDEAFALLEAISASERILFRLEEDEAPFGGDCRIERLSRSGFWVSFDRGFNKFFWSLEGDGITFDNVAPFSLSDELQKTLPAFVQLAPRLLISTPDKRHLLLIAVVKS